MKISAPNLPKGRVSLAVVGEEYPEIIADLAKMDIEVISVSAAEDFAKYERSHPDLRLHHLGGKDVMIYREDTELCKALSSKGFSVVFAERKRQKTYPYCAGLNALRIGDILLCNEKAIDPALKKEAENRGLELVFCKQGYSRCATCLVNEKAVITSDPSVYSALKDKIDVLKIKAGHIRLADTYDGMIGGCSAMMGETLLAFCGDIEKHPDFNIIKNFLLKHSVKYVCLNKNELIDVGTIIGLEIGKYS